MSPLPRDVEELLRERIETFEELEILLVLYANTAGEWTAEAVAQRLGAATSDVAEALEHLRRAELVSSEQQGETTVFRYRPGSPALDTTVALLAAHHGHDRLDVIRALNANAIERVRTGAIRAFADAFVVKPGNNKDE